jgi:leader peptidase (prepilin peptidase)/N-methyltransferase
VLLAPLLLAVAVLAFADLTAAQALIATIAGWTLIVVSAIDMQRRIIPNRIVLPATAIVLVAQLVLFPGHAEEWIIAMLAAGVAFLIPHMINPAWIGMGDVKLALLLGAALGWSVLSAVMLAFLCAFPVALALLVRSGIGARRAAMPFGPFLALGALLMLLIPHAVS